MRKSGYCVQSDVQRLLSAVEDARVEVTRSAADLSPFQAAYKPSAASWSCAEVIEHLYLAEVSGVAKIWSASNDLRSGKGWTGESPHRGKPIEQIIRETWKPLEKAPSIATPHIGGPLAFWLSAFRSLSSVLGDLAAALQGQRLELIVFPHFISGPLDARQRLEFLRFQMQRHVGQIERIREDPLFPAGLQP
jgi:hypothetical protein